MRIAVFTNWYWPSVGGAAINIHRHCREMVRQGHQVTVLTPDRTGDAATEVHEGVRIRRFRDALNPGVFPNKSPSTRCPEVLGEMLDGGYDVIHCYPAMSIHGWYAILAKIARGVRIFLTVFDLHDYRRLDVARFPSLALLEDEHRKLGFARRLKFGLPWRWFDRIFTISDTELAFLRRFNPRVQRTVVPVDLAEFDAGAPGRFRQKHGLDPARPMVLCLSRVCWHKGQDVLLEAVPGLRRVRPDAQVVFAGSGFDPEFMDRLRARTRELGVEDGVRFTGEMPWSDVIDSYHDCDLHVVPVRFMNAGAIIMEAWACAKPNLQSDRIDPCHVVAGENGDVFRLDDRADLEAKLAALLADPARLARMGRNGRRLVEAGFTYPQAVRVLLDAYAGGSLPAPPAGRTP
jgi:glycosyltransferase involved in cell wall biosynthesis